MGDILKAKEWPTHSSPPKNIYKNKIYILYYWITGGYKNAGESGKDGLFKNGRDVGQDF
jgi:hypothetical protein